jgi:hypothetical protein
MVRPSDADLVAGLPGSEWWKLSTFSFGDLPIGVATMAAYLRLRTASGVLLHLQPGFVANYQAASAPPGDSRQYDTV